MGSYGALVALLGTAAGIGTGEVVVPTPVARVAARPALAAFFPAMPLADIQQYHAFRDRYVASDGRVIDTGNGDVSHTEGQGLGMLFAVMFDDYPTFDRIFSWTQQTLTRPNDALYSWRYDPNSPDHVEDLNNATDGDMFIAAALWRAGLRWNAPGYLAAARTMATSILQCLVAQAGPYTVLLPAVAGFQHARSVTINPSYLCFPILRDLARALPSPTWHALEESGLALIAAGRFGRWGLPPDWLSISLVDGTLRPALGWPALFSYDAIRIPLYLAWAQAKVPAAQDSIQRFWAQTSPQTPAWVDLTSDRTAAYGYTPGMQAVAAMTSKMQGEPGVALLPLENAPDYYSASLTLLSRLAVHTRATW